MTGGRARPAKAKPKPKPKAKAKANAKQKAKPNAKANAKAKPNAKAKASARGRARAPASVDATAGPMRLQKALARAGISSRRGGEELIESGRVEVNGRVVTELGTKIDPARDKIVVDGKAIAIDAPTYVVLNKPDGYVSSAEPEVDDRGRATVVSLVRASGARLSPVGRLDYHTRGVLLLTNDGDLSSRLLHPRYAIPKTYHVKFQGRLQLEELQRLDRGVTLEDGTVTKPLAELIVIRETETNTWAQLTLTQSLNRQVRRMGDAIGHPVLKLLRVAFAEIGNDGLAEGQWRHLREAEIAELRARTGLAGTPSRGRARAR